MLHELIATMLGCPGSPFVEEDDGVIRIAKGLDFLHPAEENIINRLCLLAMSFKKLDQFVQINKFRTKGPGVFSGLYGSAFVSGVGEVLEPYRTAVWKIEMEALSDSHISLTHFLQLEVHMPLFQRLLDLIGTIEAKKPHGCGILEVVYNYCNCGISSVEVAMQRILRACHGVLFNQVRHWMLRGVFVDPYKELFFGPESEDAIKCSASGTYETYNSNVSMVRVKFILKPEVLPSYIPSNLALNIITVGEAVDILDPFVYGPIKKKSRPETEFRKKEEEYTKKLYAVYQQEHFSVSQFISVVGEIKACSAEELWKAVVKDAELVSYLKTVKDFFLLGKGELFVTFIDMAADMLNKPAIDKTASVIDHIFKKAIINTSREGEKFSEMFHVVPHPKITDSQEVDKAKAKIKTGWTSIGLSFSVPFPLDITFTSKLLERYNSMFRFLLIICRVQIELHRCWAFQMCNKSSGRDPQLVPLWQLCSHMSFLVDNLHYYIQVDVIESQFSKLMNKVETVKNFEALHQAHEFFLQSVVSQCFMHLKPVFSCLLEILDICLAFCSFLRKLENSSSSFDMSRFATLKLNFQRQTSVLFRILCSIRNPQISPHLAQFLLRIDYNKYLSRSGGHLGGPDVKPCDS